MVSSLVKRAATFSGVVAAVVLASTVPASALNTSLSASFAVDSTCVNGKVVLVGTITNETNYYMNTEMSTSFGKTSKFQVAPGETATTSVATGRAKVSANYANAWTQWNLGGSVQAKIVVDDYTALNCN